MRTTKITLLLIALCAIATVQCYGQAAAPFAWAKHFGNGLYDYPRDLTTDVAGNIYACGNFESACDFDPGPGTFTITPNGGTDIFVMKLDPDGNLVYAKKMGGPGYRDWAWAMTVDNAGNAYVTGGFEYTVDFDPGPGVFNMTSNGNDEIFVLKLDTGGNFVWAKRIGGSTSDYGKSIAVDNSGNVYVTGIYGDSTAIDFDPGAGVFNMTSNGTTGWPDIFLLKLNSAGNFVWAKKMGSSYQDFGEDITVDGAGNVYTTGVSPSSGIDWDPGSGSSYFNVSGQTDVFLQKLDANGNFAWVKRIGGTGTDRGKTVDLDPSGNIYITGQFTGTGEFDPGAGTYNILARGTNDIFVVKLDAAGNFQWARSMGGTGGGGFEDRPMDAYVDASGNIYTTGNFTGTADFNPAAGSLDFVSHGDKDAFISKLDRNGDFVWAKRLGSSTYEEGLGISADSRGNVYTILRYTNPLDADPGAGTFNISPAGMCILKLGQDRVHGYLYNDISQDCVKDQNEIGIARRVYIMPGNIVAEADSTGVWSVDSLPAGIYTATVDTTGKWKVTCSASQTFTVSNPNGFTRAPSFGFYSTEPCAMPDVSILCPRLRRCWSPYTYVWVSNKNTATGPLENAYVDVQLDPMLTMHGASSIPFTTVGNNTWRFNVGNINPGTDFRFWFACSVHCSAPIGLTCCMLATLYPADTCIFDEEEYTAQGIGVTPCSLPFDNSDMTVTGVCVGDSARFMVQNTAIPGFGDMDCFAPVRIYQDGQLYRIDSLRLNGGSSAIYSFLGEGHTWRLETSQHPLYPGISHPNATVEACPDTVNWIPGQVNTLPEDDADPVVDFSCGQIIASCDPNDKTGFPTGVSTEHYILPNQHLEYMIRFQNVGNDTAFDIVIRDTLDTDLDIFSVASGASTHDYTFRMYGPRVMEWTYRNILLPDSNTNEPLSYGAVTFKVNQNKNLSNGTKIHNSCGIYFDYNEPVITNTTVHTINDNLLNYTGIGTGEIKTLLKKITLYPNPTQGQLHIRFDEANTNVKVEIRDITGKTVHTVSAAKGDYIDLRMEQAAGLYFVSVSSDENRAVFKVLKE